MERNRARRADGLGRGGKQTMSQDTTRRMNIHTLSSQEDAPWGATDVTPPPFALHDSIRSTNDSPFPRRSLSSRHLLAHRLRSSCTMIRKRRRGGCRVEFGPGESQGVREESRWKTRRSVKTFRYPRRGLRAAAVLVQRDTMAHQRRVGVAVQQTAT